MPCFDMLAAVPMKRLSEEGAVAVRLNNVRNMI
jgi:hypothetical protein